MLESACRALEQLCSNEDNQKRAGDEEGIAALVKMLRREAASDELLESACIALGCMCFGNVSNTREAVNDENGIVVLVKILRREATSERVIVSACMALVNMCFGDDDLTSEAVHNEEVIAAVVSVLGRERSLGGKGASRRVVDLAWLALRNIWFCKNQSINDMISIVNKDLSRKVSKGWLRWISKNLSRMFDMNELTSHSTSSEDSDDGATRGRDGEAAGGAAALVCVHFFCDAV